MGLFFAQFGRVFPFPLLLLLILLLLTGILGVLLLIVLLLLLILVFLVLFALLILLILLLVLIVLVFLILLLLLLFFELSLHELVVELRIVIVRIVEQGPAIMLERLLQLLHLESIVPGVVAGPNQVFRSQCHGGCAVERDTGLLHIAAAEEGCPEIVQ